MKDKHICPWWLADTFDNPLRRYFHYPHALLMSYLKEGMTVIDIGCGMGYFSREMAKIVGNTGKVIAADLQQEMLAITLKRAEKEGWLNTFYFYSRITSEKKAKISETACKDVFSCI